jgi:Domain of unknown function (DUF4269)
MQQEAEMHGADPEEEIAERPDYSAVVAALRIFQRLGSYSPELIGTPPLGIAVPGSDIDIACHAPDLDAFAVDLVREFGSILGFALDCLEIRGAVSIVCGFRHAGWHIEIFGQPVPVAQQWGMRHFRLERRLLDLLGPDFRARIVALKRSGLKTEPAFAQLFGLKGDPYEALLTLEDWPDDRLRALTDR